MSTNTVGPSPIESILLASRIVRPEPGHAFTASSLPGHLLHYVLSGRVRQQCNGRTYDLEPGAVLWYHEDEWVEGVVLESPWVFYSINFIAPCLPPPPDEARLLFPAPPRAAEYFAALHETWENQALSAQVRLFRLHARLLNLLEVLVPAIPAHAPPIPDEGAQLWWKLETAVRRDLSAPVGLRYLAERSGYSTATIARACQGAVGTSPMRRIKQIRLSFARGLVQRSQLSFSQIAERVGYGRVHEFSRDYRRSFGVSPSADRSGFRQELLEQQLLEQQLLEKEN